MTENVIHIQHTGNFLSWRGQRHTHVVHCRLDRAVANSKWSDLFPNVYSHYLKLEASDHRPLVSTFNVKRKKFSRLFRYDRRLRDNPEVADLIDKAWTSYPEEPVAKKIGRCRQAIAIWSKEKYVSSRKQIIELKEALDLVLSTQSTDDSAISLLITNPDCLFSRIILGKYCHKTFFLKVTPSSAISHGWRGILRGRDLLLQHLGKTIGDGESTSSGLTPGYTRNPTLNRTAPSSYKTRI